MGDATQLLEERRPVMEALLPQSAENGTEAYGHEARVSKELNSRYRDRAKSDRRLDASRMKTGILQLAVKNRLLAGRRKEYGVGRPI